MIQPNTVCKLCLAPALQLWTSDQCCNPGCRNYHADIAYDAKFDNGAVRPEGAQPVRGASFPDTSLEHKRLDAPAVWRYKISLGYGDEYVEGVPFRDSKGHVVFAVREIARGEYRVDHVPSGRGMQTASLPFFDNPHNALYFAQQCVHHFPCAQNQDYQKARFGSPFNSWLKYMAYLIRGQFSSPAPYTIWKGRDA